MSAAFKAGTGPELRATGTEAPVKSAQALVNRVWLLLILGAAFALRLYRLGVESLWYDETVSVYLAAKNLTELVAHTARDIHPPGYYVLLAGWTRLAGDSDWAAAYLSLFFGLLLVALTYRLMCRYQGVRAALLAALLVALSPYNLWYSQEVRMYTLGAVLGLGALAVTLALLSPSAFRRPPRILWLTYALLGSLGLWTLYYFAFLLIAVNLMVLTWWLWSSLRAKCAAMGSQGSAPQVRTASWLVHWLLAQIAVLVFYAPWLPIAWRQATNPPVPPWRGATSLGDLLVESWTALSFGQSAAPARIWPGLVLVALLFVLGLFGDHGRHRIRVPVAWFWAGYTFLPVVLIAAASTITPLFHVRYLFTYSTPFYMVIALGLVSLISASPQRFPDRSVWPHLWRAFKPAVATLAVLSLLSYSGLSIAAYHADLSFASDDHRTAAAFLAERWRPGDAILVNAGYAYTALVHYWDGPPVAWRGRLVGPSRVPVGAGPHVFQTGTVDGQAFLGWGDPRSDFYAMSRSQAAAALEQIFAVYDRIWIYRIYDTVTDESGFVRAWLEDHGQLYEDQVFTGESQLRVQGFLTGRDPLAGTQDVGKPSLASDSLILDGVQQAPVTVAVGGSLDLSLTWHVNHPLQGEPVLFAGLFDVSGRRWAQTDERPLGSQYPVTDWSPGAGVRTPVHLTVPSGMPPGTYRLEVGWYRFQDGVPLWLPWKQGDRFHVQDVQVVPAADWWSLPLPEVDHALGVTLGSDLWLAGFSVPTLSGAAGDALSFDLIWQALAQSPQPGAVVLQLADQDGALVFEQAGPPAGGLASFPGLDAGQALADHHEVILPGTVKPGMYTLSVGRRQGGGTWLPIRRGISSLDSPLALATVRVEGRPVRITPLPYAYAVDAQFGEGIALVGYDLEPQNDALTVTLHWRSLAPVDDGYKIFVHLVGRKEPSDIRAQVDTQPHLPTSGWITGEFLTDSVSLALPDDPQPGIYTLLLGWYHQDTGQRLPVTADTREIWSDSVVLGELSLPIAAHQAPYCNCTH